MPEKGHITTDENTRIIQQAKTQLLSKFDENYSNNQHLLANDSANLCSFRQTSTRHGSVKNDNVKVGFQSNILSAKYSQMFDPQREETRTPYAEPSSQLPVGFTRKPVTQE